MHIFSRPLAAAVKNARRRMKLTQEEVANMIDADTRTISAIENNDSNTRMTTLYPLIKCLHIDPRDIFYPEAATDSSARGHLRILIDDCTAAEAEALVPVCESVLKAMRTDHSMKIEEKSLFPLK